VPHALAAPISMIVQIHACRFATAAFPSEEVIRRGGHLGTTRPYALEAPPSAAIGILCQTC
jgi:hypothetical protein